MNCKISSLYICVKDMDRAIENFKMGTVSPAIDLSDF